VFTRFEGMLYAIWYLIFLIEVTHVKPLNKDDCFAKFSYENVLLSL
jgi:hypothetical protein